MRNYKILLIVLASVIISGAVSFIISASILTKFIGEKYGEQLIGRKIRMSWAYVNPFTGYVHLSKLKVYEYKNDSVFVAMDGLTANFSMLKLLSKKMEISSLTLNQPTVKIIQRKLSFNFDDFGRTFARKGPPAANPKPFQFYFLNVKIHGGHFYYIDEVIPVNFSIKNVEVQSKAGWRWDRDVIAARVSFLSEAGTGGMDGSFGMNLKTLFYKMDVVVKNFDLNVIEQYMHEFSNYGTFRANLDADLRTNGCFTDAENVNLHGNFAISDFHIGKDTMNDYVAFRRIEIKMNKVNPLDLKYFIDSIKLSNPYVRFDRYDYGLDNIQTMFGRAGYKVSAATSDEKQFNLVFTIGRYIKKLVKHFLKSHYKVNHLGIENANIHYNDYALSEKFEIQLNPLNITADSVYKKRNRANISLRAGIKPFGNISIFLSISPKDTGNFDVQYKIQNVAVAMFNAYTVTYTSYPFNDGTFELKGNWSVRNSMLNSQNHLIIINPRVGDRIKNDNQEKLPIPLIMFLLRSKGNVIDYELPVNGNLKDPKFLLWNLVWDVTRKLFIGTTSLPHVIQIRKKETEIDKALSVKWSLRQSSLLPAQERFIKKMAEFLLKNPAASITVYPKNYANKEKEYLMFYEARKKYYLIVHHKSEKSFGEEDSAKVDNLGIKDSAFVKFLNKTVNDSMIFTIQDKCSKFVSPAIVEARFEQLNSARLHAFMRFFKEKGVEKRVRIAAAENVIPFNGFSFYKIEYHGVLPDALIREYHQMDDLKSKVADNKLKEKRRKKNGK